MKFGIFSEKRLTNANHFTTQFIREKPFRIALKQKTMVCIRTGFCYQNEVPI